MLRLVKRNNWNEKLRQVLVVVVSILCLVIFLFCVSLDLSLAFAKNTWFASRVFEERWSSLAPSSSPHPSCALVPSISALTIRFTSCYCCNRGGQRWNKINDLLHHWVPSSSSFFCVLFSSLMQKWWAMIVSLSLLLFSPFNRSSLGLAWRHRCDRGNEGRARLEPGTTGNELIHQ